MAFLQSYGSNILLAFAGSITGFLLGRAFCILADSRLVKVSEYVFNRLEKIYFCGYDLKAIHLTQFFPRYRKFVDWGFCGPVAGMSMLAMKGNPHSRYVLARAGKNRYEHCWVEFEYQKHWFVIDPCWSWPFVIPKARYYRENKPQILQVCEYDQFWSYPISQQFYEKMQNPNTSWLLVELMQTYSFYEETGQLFDPKIKEILLDEDTGKHINLWLFYAYPEIIFSRSIMHEMMQRPKRERPTAHQIRHVKSFQRKVKHAYEEFLRTHPDSDDSTETKAAS